MSQVSASLHRPPSLFVVILNWNAWRYTLPCLESVLRSDYERLGVIVCDNGSTDDSVSAMEAWARGELEIPLPLNQRLRRLVTPPLTGRPRSVFVHESGQFGGVEDCEGDVLFLLRKTNGSYSAGNNTGLRLALQLGAQYVWILNNDTLVEPTSARHVVEQMQADSRIGLCGTTIHFYDTPERIQLHGGWHYSRWIARPTPLLRPPTTSRHLLSYVEGASVFVSRSFLEEIGLLCEEYVFYGEEMDWAARSASKFSLSYCPEALVYHKGAGTIAETLSDAQREYYGMRSRLLLTRKFWPVLLLTVWPSMLARAIVRVFQGRLGAARSILLAIAGKPLPDSMAGNARLPLQSVL